ncbi:unnamed protein product [Gongylonema pulchrum]|uniref:Uncharacterized protein n=1 Tax=Gongylonema pulchrum TaxID=637853 RepID=A0A3P6RBM3_9BILA|nr:unnamed protein product [Gongylonema pulchrum]
MDVEQTGDHNIDANNDETFGVDVDDEVVDDDLEQYAKQVFFIIQFPGKYFPSLFIFTIHFGWVFFHSNAFPC